MWDARMEGKKRKRKELSLKTSKKQAVWRTHGQTPEQGCTNGAFQTEGCDSAIKTCHVIAACIPKETEKRTDPFLENAAACKDDMRIQLKALLPTCQTWEDLEDLPASEMLGLEQNQNNCCKDQRKHSQHQQDELGQVTGDESEDEFGYMDLPKPTFSLLNKPTLLDVEHILQESVQNDHSKKYQIESSVGENLTLHSSWSPNRTGCWEHAPIVKSMQGGVSPSHSRFSGIDRIDRSKIDVVDLTEQENGVSAATDNKTHPVKTIPPQNNFAGNWSKACQSQKSTHRVSRDAELQVKLQTPSFKPSLTTGNILSDKSGVCMGHNIPQSSKSAQASVAVHSAVQKANLGDHTGQLMISTSKCQPSTNTSNAKYSPVRKSSREFMTSLRSCSIAKNSSSFFQNSPQIEDTLKCCPICQCKFSAGTSRKQIDQHISECVELGAIMDDDEDW